VASVERILHDLGLAETPRLLVWNKIDLLPPEERERLLEAPRSVAISAADASTTGPLLAAIETALWRGGVSIRS
jgi:GTP-binding protein HflX